MTAVLFWKTVAALGQRSDFKQRPEANGTKARAKAALLGRIPALPSWELPKIRG